MGFASADERGNALAGRNNIRMDLFNDTFDCPSIHFVSGISEYIGDSSKAILSYGVNDCYPRMIVVEKKDIERSLLRG